MIAIVFVILLRLFVVPHSFEPPYDFSHPETVFVLPHELDEISGLGTIDSLHVVAVQDEKGYAYVVSLEDGRITKRKRFDKNGDYEAIEVVSQTLFALRSDGRLARSDNWLRKKMKTKKIRLRLPTGCDAEGLTFESETSHLLVVCKENPGKGLRDVRSIYAFTTDGERTDFVPYRRLNYEALSRLSGKTILRKEFKPASLAIHPVSRNLYIISSTSPEMVILDNTGKLLWTRELHHNFIRQPEGLTFLPDGTLVLSSEAAGKKAALLVYRMTRP